MADQVLYLESDEEITSAIDKLTRLPGSAVSVVVPKRSTLLQSIVNLKLLKKAADDSGKNLVIVTADRTSTHLAGKVGLAVATTLKANASVPHVQEPTPDPADDVIDGESDADLIPPDEIAPASSSKAATARTNGKPGFAKPMFVRQPTEAIGSEATAVSATSGSKVNVPDFNSLQKRLLMAGAAVAVIALLAFLNFWLKTAHVTLYAKGTAVKAAFNFTVDPAARESDADKALLAGQKLELTKDLSSSFSATGKKDVGTKASGTVTIKNCEDSSAKDFPAGSTVSSQGKSFRTDAPVTIPGGTFSGGGAICTAATVSVAVTAAENGDSYNLGPAQYTSPTLTSNFRISGNQMTGGTSKQITIVTAADIDKAQAEAVEKSLDQAREDLADRAASGYQVIAESFNHTVIQATASPAVDEEATQVALALKVTYTLLAVNRDDFVKMVKTQEQKLVGDQNQIYQDGIDQAKIVPGKREPNARQEFSFNSEAFAGAKIDLPATAKQLSGQRYGDAADIAAKLPGIERAEISLKPSWSSRLPRRTNHIEIEVKAASQD
jgi:hypothetical protein